MSATSPSVHPSGNTASIADSIVAPSSRWLITDSTRWSGPSVISPGIVCIYSILILFWSNTTRCCRPSIQSIPYSPANHSSHWHSHSTAYASSISVHQASRSSSRLSERVQFSWMLSRSFQIRHSHRVLAQSRCPFAVMPSAQPVLTTMASFANLITFSFGLLYSCPLNHCAQLLLGTLN